MLGADVGTTLTAQVLSFDLGWVSPLMIAAGVIAFLSSEQDKPRHLGRVAIGLGLMLLSLKLLALATEPLRSAPAFMAALGGLQDEYVIAVVLATLATWFVHSSLSIVLLIMSFAGSGLIEPQLALALVVGDHVAHALRHVHPHQALRGRPEHGQLGLLALAGDAVGHGDVARRVDLRAILRLGGDGQRGDQDGGEGVAHGGSPSGAGSCTADRGSTMKRFASGTPR